MKNILNYINLHNGEEDKKKVLENVTANISFRGSNLWILACAIVIASVGLNVNSTAVIIGAMLISPLMGPIVGAGFALGTYDFDLLKKSLKNLLIATLVSLLVSYLYFLVSPFKETQSELLARTSPNIYDVLIAFFGGLVGVIAITRVEKGNPIPGVAIATALMPPLCTAGYSLAIGNYSYFGGAVYLYTINCFFICISTFLIVKYLKYPRVKHINKQRQKQIGYVISGLILLMIVPSFYLAYSLLNEKKYTQKVEDFINDEFINKGQVIIYKKLNFHSQPKKIELAFLAKNFTSKEVSDFNSRLKQYNLNNTELIIRQDTTNLKKDILNEINFNAKNIDQKDVVISNLQQELITYKFDNQEIIKEVRILFPEIKNLSVGKLVFNQNTDSLRNVTVMVYDADKKLDEKTEVKLSEWLKEKLGATEMKLYKE